MSVSDRHQDHGPELDATEARQGRWGRHMLWVLLIGLILAFAATLGVWALRSGDLGSVDPMSRATVEEAPPVPSATAPGG